MTGDEARQDAVGVVVQFLDGEPQGVEGQDGEREPVRDGQRQEFRFVAA